MRVAIRVDASPRIGGGHAMRCLALADALAERGATVQFVSAAMMPAIADRIEEAGHGLARIPASPELERDGDDWHAAPLTAEAQAIDAEATAAAVGSANWLIIDHYLLDRHWHSASRSFAEHLFVIDDLANRSCDCDILLDQTFGRRPSDYAGLVPAGAIVLTGAGFALLRSEFAAERRPALERRKASMEMARILVSMGTTDVGGITANVVETIIEVGPARAVDVVLGANAQSLEQVRVQAASHPNIRVHVDSRNVAALMRDADLAIGGAGTTSLERCCLGLPTIALIVAENQRTGADALARAGAIIAVDDPSTLGAALQELVGNNERLAKMSAAAFAIADGGGTKRVISAMLGEERSKDGRITLRKANIDDAERLWLWRNDALTREQSRTTDPIPWASHVQWLVGALGDPQRSLLIAERGSVSVGTVTLGSEVSISVDPHCRGSGVGKAILSAALDRAPVGPVHASVREDNEASRRLFEACDFSLVSGSEPGFVQYAYHRRDQARRQA